VLDTLAAEEPLEIRVRGRSVAVTMRTPGHDAELAAGFLLTEGIIRHAKDVLDTAPCSATDADSQGNVLNVFLAPSVEVDFASLTRHVFASSSCGVCGKASIEAVHLQFPALKDRFKVSARTLRGLPEKLRAAQAVFEQTGGLHAAGLFDAKGALRVAREDVGRHNAVDKVIGHALLAGWLPMSRHILLVSGRASFEIMHPGGGGHLRAVQPGGGVRARIRPDAGRLPARRDDERVFAPGARARVKSRIPDMQDD
jgi:FdhD protein